MNDRSLSSSSVALEPNASTALESARILRTSYGNLYSINCFSTAAGFLIVIDANSIPANGATLAPKFVMSVPANGTLMYDWTDPLRFMNGCVALFSSNASPFIYTPSPTAYFSGSVV